jgi:predicted aspartyl protease
MPIPSQAFTARANGRSLRLITEIEIFPPFAPTTTSLTAAALPAQGKKYQGLYDTGATNSAISPRVVADLQLDSIGARTVGVGGGSLSTTAHLVNIGLPNRVMFPMVPVAKMVLLGGIDVLIGMDILGTGDFAVTHQDGKTVFSFCTPSRRHIDFVSELQLQQNQKNVPRTSIPKVPRNAPCPCGSGKKYKGCHGRHF